jgi:DNA-binding CsgD family transcriptional regulator
LLARLDSRYEVLVGGSRAVLPRQQTLRALIDWSFALCTRDEKLLWARLSIFADGFTLDSAEQVCSDERLPASAILITMEGLVEKSIVSPVRDWHQVRYRLAETLREYGANRLDEFDERALMQRRLRDWVRGLVDRMQTQWVSSAQAELLATLRQEHANIRLALQYCLTTPGEIGSGLVMASTLRHYWTASGRLGEGRHWLGRLLAQDREPTTERVRGLCTCAFLTTGPTETDSVDHMLDEAEELTRALGDRSGIDLVRQVRGIVQLFRGRPRDAVRLLEAAAAGARRGNDLSAIVNDLALVGLAKTLAGDQGASLALNECVALCARAGESWFRATALWTVGLERCLSGDLAGAVAAQRASLDLRLPLGGWYPITTNLDVLAWVAVEGDEPERAAHLFGAAEAIMRDLGEFLVSHGPTASLHVSYLERCRQMLGPKAFDIEFEIGLQMGFDAAVAYAVGRLAAPDVPVRSTDDVPRAAAPNVLTAREFEVARLVAQGLTNRQIAAALVISHRTAEGHVEHILVKLGFTSRAQIAAWATRWESP